MFYHQHWFIKLYHLLRQALFVLCTAVLTYWNGIHYSLLELARNLQIFGLRKVDFEKEFNRLLTDQVCVITGGTRGIGLHVVRFLLSRNCTIITGTSSLSAKASSEEVRQYWDRLVSQVLCTTDANANQLLRNNDIREQFLQRLIVLPLDLASMSSVLAFVEQIKQCTNRIDYLICNGGVMFVPYRVTSNHFESHMSINYYSHCLLTVKLLPLLATTPGTGRVVVVSSGAHHASYGLRLHDLNSTEVYSIYHSYAQSKLALIMFTYRFNRWLRDTQAYGHSVSINCLHPGICRTTLMERFNFFKLKCIQELPLFRSAEEGTETILFTTLSDSVESTSGAYFEDCRLANSSDTSRDQTLQDRLWKQTWTDLKPWLTLDECRMLVDPELIK